MNFAGFLIPGYYSLDALFSASKADDTQVSLYNPQSLRSIILGFECATGFANIIIVVNRG